MKRPGFKINIQLKQQVAVKGVHFALIKWRPYLAAKRKLLMQRKEQVHPRVRAKSWQQHPRGDQRGQSTKFRQRGWHRTGWMALGVARVHSSIMSCTPRAWMVSPGTHWTPFPGGTLHRRLHLSNPKHPLKTAPIKELVLFVKKVNYFEQLLWTSGKNFILL